MQQDKKNKAIEALKAGATWTEAAAAVGVTRPTLWRWTQLDPEFAAAAEDARAGPDSEVEAVTYANCLDPDPAHNVLRMFWLKCRKPAIYQDRQHQQHSGSIGIAHTYVEPGLPPSPLGSVPGSE
jgi:hypothetical protein